MESEFQCDTTHRTGDTRNQKEHRYPKTRQHFDSIERGGVLLGEYYLEIGSEFIINYNAVCFRCNRIHFYGNPATLAQTRRRTELNIVGLGLKLYWQVWSDEFSILMFENAVSIHVHVGGAPKHDISE